MMTLVSLADLAAWAQTAPSSRSVGSSAAGPGAPGTVGTNQPKTRDSLSRPSNLRIVTSSVTLTSEDIAMANAAIAKNTFTLTLPGLGTSVDGPGPLTAADRLVLFALKLHQQRHAVVPFGEMNTQVGRVETIQRNCRVAEEFWAWYRESASKHGKEALGGYKEAFTTYITMKTTAKRKAANRVLAGQVESQAAWRRAMDSDRQFREHIAQRTEAARAARERTWAEWNMQAAEAAASQKEWELYLTHGAGHMDRN